MKIASIREMAQLGMNILLLDQVEVAAALHHQLRVTAALAYFSVLDIHDHVSVLNRGQSMGDRDAGSALASSVKRRLDSLKTSIPTAPHLFRLRVQS